MFGAALGKGRTTVAEEVALITVPRQMLMDREAWVQLAWTCLRKVLLSHPNLSVSQSAILLQPSPCTPEHPLPAKGAHLIGIPPSHHQGAAEVETAGSFNLLG